MTFHSGLTGTATINGTEVPLKDWTADPGIRVAETDNSKSASFMLREASGGKTCAFSFLIDFDFDANPFAAPLNLVIGTKIVQVKLFLNGTSGLFWLFPSAVVAATPQGLNHSGTDMINVRVNCVNDGTFSYPGGVTP